MVNDNNINNNPSSASSNNPQSNNTPPNNNWAPDWLTGFIRLSNSIAPIVAAGTRNTNTALAFLWLSGLLSNLANYDATRVAALSYEEQVASAQREIRLSGQSELNPQIASHTDKAHYANTLFQGISVVLLTVAFALQQSNDNANSDESTTPTSVIILTIFATLASCAVLGNFWQNKRSTQLTTEMDQRRKIGIEQTVSNIIPIINRVEVLEEQSRFSEIELTKLHKRILGLRQNALELHLDDDDRQDLLRNTNDLEKAVGLLRQNLNQENLSDEINGLTTQVNDVSINLKTAIDTHLAAHTSGISTSMAIQVGTNSSDDDKGQEPTPRSNPSPHRPQF